MRIQAIVLAIAILFLLFLPSLAVGQTDPLGLADGQSVLFIDAANPNCDDTAGRAALDPATPWCSLVGMDEMIPPNQWCGGTVVQRLYPGDMVYMRAATYSHELDLEGAPGTIGMINVCSSGTVEAPITLVAYPGDAPVIHVGSYDQEALLNVQGSYFHLDSLNFVGNITTPGGRLSAHFLVRYIWPDNNGHSTGGHHGEVRGVSISDFQSVDDIGYDARGTAGGVGLLIQQVDSFLVDGVDVGCTTDPATIYPDNQGKFRADGIRIANSANVTVRNSDFYDCGHVSLLASSGSTNVRFDTNTVRNRLHTGIGASDSSQLIVRNNEVYDWNQFPSESSLGGHAIELLRVNGSLVFNNLIYNGGFLALGISVLGNSENGQPTGPASDNDILNNLIFNSGRAGLNLTHPRSSHFPDGTTGLNAITNNRVHDNIIFRINDYGRLYDAELVLQFMDRSYDEFVNISLAAGNTFNNNLLLSSVAGEATVTYSEMFRHEADIPIDVLNSPDTTIGDGNVGSDTILQPEDVFEDPSIDDFRPKAGSLAIGAGSCDPLVPFDYDGWPRPAANCDIGPYEGGTVALTSSEDSVASNFVSGDHLDTWTWQEPDSTTEQIEEVMSSGGKPSKRYSTLDHRWTFEVAEGDLVNFHLLASLAGPASEAFAFSYSGDDGASWSPLAIVNSIAPTWYEVPLPAGTGGAIVIRAEDVDSSQGEQVMDGLAIDQMHIRSKVAAAGGGGDTLTIASQVVTRSTKGKNRKGICDIRIENLSGSPVGGATVEASYTGPTSGIASDVTDGNGEVTLSTEKMRDPPSDPWCFTVTDVSAPGATWDAVASEVCEP